MLLVAHWRPLTYDLDNMATLKKTELFLYWEPLPNVILAVKVL
jgi:hypothetical protein